MSTTLVPAYGRDYKTAKAVKADWEAGKDFIIADHFHPYDGKPTNKTGSNPGESFMIRFDGLRKITHVKA